MNLDNTVLVKPDGKPIRALVVDDESSISDLVAIALKYEKFEVRTAASGRDAVSVASEFDPDIVILDIMLPDFDGLEVMKRIRSAQKDVPVLFLTAKDDVKDRIAGLTAGGDDYVTKPFSIEELVARIRGIVRRTLVATITHENPEIQVDDLVLNEETYEVFRGDTRVELTATEFELLRYLMRNPKRVLSKAQILDRVWSYDFGGRSSIVEIYISYLRKKIDTLGPALIHTVRGVGYVIRPAR
ncbi:MAG: response regulator transcription factor [Microbacteriaceae bacterium]